MSPPQRCGIRHGRGDGWGRGDRCCGLPVRWRRLGYWRRCRAGGDRCRRRGGAECRRNCDCVWGRCRCGFWRRRGGGQGRGGRGWSRHGRGRGLGGSGELRGRLRRGLQRQGIGALGDRAWRSDGCRRLGGPDGGAVGRR
jgi:hypothetical protein